MAYNPWSYDQAAGSWFYTDPNTGIRDKATEWQVTNNIRPGAASPTGPGGQTTTPPVVTAPARDPYGLYPAINQPAGHPAPDAPPPAAPAPAAPAPATPAAPHYQHMGPQTGFSFGNLDGTQTVAYDDPSNRGVGWQKLTDYLNPGNTSANYGRWLGGQMGDQFARFNVSQFADPKNTGNDWLSYLEKIAPGMRNQFLGLSSSQNGNNYGNYESGNWLG